MNHRIITNQDPYQDSECVSAFVEQNYEDFEQCMNDKGVCHDYYVDYEHEYCEANDSRFQDFADNYHEDRALAEGDAMNELKGDCDADLDDGNTDED